MAVDAAFERTVVDEVVDVYGLGLFDHAGDLDWPGAGVKLAGVVGGVGFVGAELVKIVVVACLREWSLRVGQSVLAGDGLELVGGVNRCCRIGEATNISGGKSACTESGCTGEEAATAFLEFLELLEGVLRRNVGGTDGGFEAAGFAEKQCDLPSKLRELLS
jgi:hypothetical protein